MKRLAIALSIVCASAVAGPVMAQDPASDTESFLFLEKADRAVASGGRIAFRGIDGSMVMFSDRPFRNVRTIRIEDFIDAWNEGADDVKQDPPNVAITGLDGGRQVGVVAVLSEPILSDTELSFSIRTLAGDLPDELSDVSVVIDGLGFFGCCF